MVSENSITRTVKVREEPRSVRNEVPGPGRHEETLQKSNSRPVGKQALKRMGLEAELQALPENNRTAKF